MSGLVVDPLIIIPKKRREDAKVDNITGAYPKNIIIKDKKVASIGSVSFTDNKLDVLYEIEGGINFGEDGNITNMGDKIEKDYNNKNKRGMESKINEFRK